MRNLVLKLRNRYHPLFYLRKLRIFQSITRLGDFPIAIRFPHIPHRIYVSLSKNLSFVLSGGEAGENRERHYFRYLCELAQFTHFADVGANIGLYGFLFKSIVEHGVVTMFEPDPSNASLILRTILRKRVSGVKLLKIAVSDVNDTVKFSLDDLSGATGSIKRAGGAVSFVSLHHRYTPREINVKSLTLDYAFANSQAPDFIKIDVEGAELRVLQGASALLSKSKPAIFFECDENQAEVQAFLATRGYVLFDFTSLQQIKTPRHNSLALHFYKHASLIHQIRAEHPTGNSA